MDVSEEREIEANPPPLSSVESMSQGCKAALLGTSEETLHDLLGSYDWTQVVRVKSLRGQVPQIEPGKRTLTFPGSGMKDLPHRVVLLKKKRGT